MFRICKYITLFSIILIGCNKKQEIDFSPISPENNLAFNDGNTLYPNPLESDEGWGGGIYQWHLVDGIRMHLNFWTMGLAFTGGELEFVDTCGWRQATIDFGSPVTFNRVKIWHHDAYIDVLPDSFYIQYWDSALNDWKTAKHVTGKRKQCFEIINDYLPLQKKFKTGVFPYEESFPAVTSSKVRYRFNNCGIWHGWLTEFEVYNDPPGN